MLTTKQKSSEHKARDISAALQFWIQNNGPPRVVEGLLELLISNDGDVNIIRKSNEKWKHMKGVDQEDKRLNSIFR